ncbi:hypothetical protein MtrunA17_Chr4g0034011 [Medicago truncatula]|uniref:Transmembrane protein n=1 Tax=Medicago truncatula TaxID=3880 RepID=A0A396I8Q6_MEDTR|nr:hypothetical protein MtrunA17_Chr4g0034011 [Medicago truncatula]
MMAAGCCFKFGYGWCFMVKALCFCLGVESLVISSSTCVDMHMAHCMYTPVLFFRRFSATFLVWFCRVDAGVCMWSVICICRRQLPSCVYGWFFKRVFVRADVSMATNFPFFVFFFSTQAF